jgi:hypothetical protein
VLHTALAGTTTFVKPATVLARPCIALLAFAKPMFVRFAWF